MRNIVRILCFLITINISSFALSAPAYKGKVRVNTDDGSVCIYIKGDENCKFAVTEDGYTLLQGTDSWYFAYKDGDGNVCRSHHKLLQKRNEATTNFLLSVEKGLQPKVQRISKIKKSNTISRNGIVARNSVIGTRRVLVVLMQFTDKKFVKTQSDFDALFNAKSYSVDGATGSVYDFYKEASYGQLNLVSDIYGPYTSKSPMSHYGGNSLMTGADKNPKALFDEAVKYLAKDADLSQYDSNGDGFIDNLHIIYAGYGEEAGAAANTIWAHQMTFSPTIVQGIKIDRYSCSPELRGNNGSGISRIGVACHEIGHALGAMDYYDTDYTDGGQYEGTGEWDVMAQGSWNNNGATPADFNPYVKAYDYGWVDVRMLSEEQTIAIYPSRDSNYVYRADTGIAGEFFLFENRVKRGINESIPGEGLLVYHIDASIEKKAQKNIINASYPQACYPVCASSSYTRPVELPASYGKINSAGCPFPGTSNNSYFGELSSPGAFCNNGEYSGIEIGDISLEDGIVHLSYNKDGSISNDNVVWKEDFENILLSSWSIDGRGRWEILNFLSEMPSEKYPKTVSGKGYVMFSREQDDNIISSRIQGNMLSNIITLPESKQCTLNFSYSKYSSQASTADTLSVYICKDGDEDNKVKVFSEEIDRVHEWQTVSIKLDSLYTDIAILLNGNIKSSSMLFVDAISITTDDSTTGISESNTDVTANGVEISIENGNCVKVCNMLNKEVDVFIYRANGELLQSQVLDSVDTQEFVLPDGMYIVKAGNNTQKIKVAVAK